MTTPEQQSAYLQAMGIQSWVRRDAPTPLPVSEPVIETAPMSQAMEPVEEPPMPTDEFAPGIDQSMVDPQIRGEQPTSPVIDTRQWDWPTLQSAVSSCTACDLHKSRTQTVFGVGNHNAQWMIIGEAPGADEDKQGEPFVGRAGQLLNNMLLAIGLKREQVFIANILKCRPPDNRNPRAEEIVKCEAYLQRQVQLVAPKVILAVGRIAAHSLLKVDTPLSRLRGKIHHYGQTPVVVTYHPAYLLRSPKEKAKSWDDLRFADAVVKGEQP